MQQAAGTGTGWLPGLPVVIAVATGGAIGALARLGVYHAVHHHGRLHSHWTTMLVNLAGCLILGLVLGWSTTRPLSETMRALVTVGILGAFTTFSTYAGDALKLMQNARVMEAMTYYVLSAAAGLFMCWVGFTIAAPAGAKIAG